MSYAPSGARGKLCNKLIREQRDEDPVLAKKKSDPGLCTSNEGRSVLKIQKTSPDTDLVKFGPDPGL